MLESRQILLVDEMLDYFIGLYPISNGFIREIRNNTEAVLVRKNKFLLSPLDQNTSSYFLANGMIRGFIKDEQKDITTWISFGNEFVGAIQHPEDDIDPSIEYLQALEDSEVVVLNNAVIQKLYDTYAETNIIGRKILAKQYHAASERSILARINSAERRYEKFLELNLFDPSSVPLRCLASFLGMRFETLSRIRTKMIKSAAVVS